MSLTHSRVRTAVLAGLAVAVLGTSGCGWFRKENALYVQDPRPLEVPPDLDRPNTDGALAQPQGAQSVSRSEVGAGASRGAPAAGTGGFAVSGDREQAFARVGEALDAIDGVTVSSRAQLLGTYDVVYGGDSFLIRVAATGEGAYVSAVDPRGVPASGQAPTELMAALRARLGN
ncbi:hypothetical protein [Luteimonas abyssi]|uniref:hypothetical protein n=1 Tax=Luteimonas abyssi TaxID=1247514 RepID=UPI000737BA2C|nr:hypothetical protein [Luteimonas abyssi]